jgi:hypothetical protein
MEPDRKLCLKRQTELRRIMMRFDQHDEAIRLFLSQHAMLHSAKMAQTEPWSFEDEVLDDMAEEQIRRIPRNCEHSVAWLIWYIARCEDVTMNLLVAGSPQVLSQDGRLERIQTPIRHTGNEMSVAKICGGWGGGGGGGGGGARPPPPPPPPPPPKPPSPRFLARLIPFQQTWTIFPDLLKKIGASESVGLDSRLGDVRFSDLRSGINPSISDQPISHRLTREHLVCRKIWASGNLSCSPRSS